MLIASHFDGRIRIRDQQLTNKGVAQAMSEAVSALPGVGQVTVNERVGSLLVIYSAAVTKLQSIMVRISDLLGEAPPASHQRSLLAIWIPPIISLPFLSLPGSSLPSWSSIGTPPDEYW